MATEIMTLLNVAIAALVFISWTSFPDVNAVAYPGSDVERKTFFNTYIVDDPDSDDNGQADSDESVENVSANDDENTEIRNANNELEASSYQAMPIFARKRNVWRHNLYRQSAFGRGKKFAVPWYAAAGSSENYRSTPVKRGVWRSQLYMPREHQGVPAWDLYGSSKGSFYNDAKRAGGGYNRWRGDTLSSLVNRGLRQYRSLRPIRF